MKLLLSVLTTRWDFLRWLRLGLGIIIISEAFKVYDWLMIALGLVLISQAVFNVGCCGASGCVPPSAARNQANTAEDTTYEEIK